MDNEKSRSQKKRESTALQKIGEQLILLPSTIVQTLALPDALREAVLHCQQLTQHEAKRRQTQYVGKLMRDIDDPEALRDAIDNAKTGLNAENVYFQRIETIRDALIHPDSTRRQQSLQDFLQTCPQCDANKLRSLIKAAIEEATKARQSDPAGQHSSRPKSRALFRWLRETMGPDQQNSG